MFPCIMVFTEPADAKTNKILFVISCFHLEVAENCVLQVYYAASSVICYYYCLRNSPKNAVLKTFSSPITRVQNFPLLVVRSWLC